MDNQEYMDALLRSNESSMLSHNKMLEETIEQLQRGIRDLEWRYSNFDRDPFNFWCYILAKHSERGIQATDNQWANGASIKQGSKLDMVTKGFWTLQWKFEPVDDGFYKIVSRYASALCLQVGGKKKFATYAQIDQWGWDNQDWQKWKVEKLGDESYKILSKHSQDKGLDVSGISYDDGAKIQLFPWSPSNSRQWLIKTGDELNGHRIRMKQELDTMKNQLVNAQRELLDWSA